MKNDTSPSARQPYSYADALHSLLIIPPSDRQPPSRPSRRGAHPDGQPALEHGLQPPAPLWQSREVPVPPAPWRSLCCDLEGCTQPAWHCSACAGSGDRPPGTGAIPALEPSRTSLQTQSQVWWLKPPIRIQASHQSPISLWVKDIFPNITQSKLCPEEDCPLPW